MLCGCLAQKNGEELSCTVSVRCDEILPLKGEGASAIAELYPEGVVFSADEAVFYDGESLMTLMLREMKDAKVSFVQEKSVAMNTSYVKGIGGISSGDFGAMSGWLYYVNGEQPSVGCSDYKLKEGDKIEWVYSADMSKSFG